ncbi:MAG: UDP-N-acetylenolpyruvoylglucosamine reductase [Candidatus Moraniibacteriota bacterium]|nr:MAG: UDP-N-acetylenolpyruvoylglucosamine reductase [Candidatus Moranbacteria bacterium]
MIDIREEVKLASFTTFDIGGNARYFVEIGNLDELEEAIAFAKEKEIHYFVLAGGSNVLFSDSGFDGLVIKIANDSMVMHGGEIICGAGTDLMGFLTFVSDNELTGGENLAGIPGSVGGAVRGNAGAFGTEMKDIVKEVHVYNAEIGKTTVFTNEQCEFTYRNSFFKKNPQYIIISVTFHFELGNKGEIDKAMYNTIAKRNSKQIQNIKSAGSWFVNPTVDDRVQKMFELDTGQKSHGGRVPAGWLLQSCNVFQKRIGDIQAGVQHANYFINMGKGTAEQALQLSTLAKTRVRDEFGVQLKEEVVLAGF